MICGGAVVLFVSDVARAVRFYVETLGMKLVAEDAETSIIDAGGGFQLALQKGTPRGSVVHFYTKVPLDEIIAIFENRGISVTGGQFDDPDGNRFVLLPQSKGERLP